MDYADEFSSDGDGDSAESMRCMHGLEHCGVCCVDYTDINEAARNVATSARTPEKMDTKNHVPVGTKCKLTDRSGRDPPEDLIGRVTGSRWAVDKVMDERAPCYVIRDEKSGEVFTHRIDDFHDEFQVWKDGEWVQPAPLDT